MIQSIEKKGNRGGGGEEESQHFFTILRCSNAQRWNRGIDSIASEDVTSPIRNTKRILRRSLIEEKASIRISVAYSRWRRIPLYGAWPNLNVSTAATIRNTGRLDKRRLNRAHRFSFVFEHAPSSKRCTRVLLDARFPQISILSCVTFRKIAMVEGESKFSVEPTSEHGEVRF